MPDRSNEHIDRRAEDGHYGPRTVEWGAGVTTADSSRNRWHAESVEDVERGLASDARSGLSSVEAVRRLERDGPNLLRSVSGRSPTAILLAQFRSLIVVLLLAAAVAALLLGEHVEAYAVLAVIGLNAAIGFFTEMRAEQALTALRKQSVQTAQVIRDGREQLVPAEGLVVGDLVTLAAGQRVPADGRVLESARLQVEEAALTGESLPTSKIAEAVLAPDAPLAERLNMVYLGTTVTDGRGTMIVTATGMGTEVGRIGLLLEESVKRETPLELRLDQLARSLVAAVGVVCAVIVGVGYLQGRDLVLMLEVGVSLAIAAVPEGLPAVATMTLAVGVQRMARANALVRRLPAVETLGSTTVICTDKTGTLTRNEMTVTALVVGNERVEVTGSGYTPEGRFLLGGQALDPGADQLLSTALRIGALCNDAEVVVTGDMPTVLGDPTEGALIVVAKKAGLEPAALERQYPRRDEIPFDSRSRRMVTLHGTPSGSLVAYVKGAPAEILERSTQHLTRTGERPLTEEDRRALLDLNRQLAADSLRVLALAYRDVTPGQDRDDLDSDLTWVGLVGMMDPLRPEVKVAVESCQGAGIRVVMITGDQAVTATAIAGRLGINRSIDGSTLRTLQAADVAGLDEAGWQRVVNESAVFARVSPEHKLRIVDALQQQRQVVAMTGDGVNDAPALRKADIGVAMGIKGTDVAKEAADMVLRDDNFATIVKAIEQGRVIYENISRFIHYLFSCNLSEVLTISIAMVLGWPLPITPLQILWLNFVTDVFPAFALALEPSAPGVMKRRARDPQERLLDWGFASLVAWQGLLLALVTLAAFSVGMSWYGTEEGLARAGTLAFMTLAFAQVFHAFNVRSRTGSIASPQLFRNSWLWAALLLCVGLQLAAVYLPMLQQVLSTVPLGWQEWALVLGLSILPLVVVELVKLLERVRSKITRWPHRVSNRDE